MAPVLARVPRWPYSLDPLIAEAKQRARRRRWLILTVLVVAVAAVAATLALRSASGSGLAAAGATPVIHIVIEDEPSTAYFDLKTGRRTVTTPGEQMWVDRQTNLHHIVSTEGGRRVADEVWKAHYGPATQAAVVDGFYAALGTDFRAALRSGTVTRAGRGIFDGHHVDWLRVLPRSADRWGYTVRALGEVGVDARTYQPILERSLLGKHYVYRRIVLAKAIPYDASDFKAHGPRQKPPYPGQLAPGFASGSTDASAPHTTAVRAPWLTAGTTVAGLRLRAATPFTISRSKHHFSYGAPNPNPMQGLELVYARQAPASPLPTLINLYGPAWVAGPTAPATTVYEVPRAPRVPPWTLLPAHSVEVQTGLTTVGSRVVPTLSIGYLKEDGLFITIRTALGENAVLQIARNLHPAR
jgi:hypothetical protein